MKRNMKKLLGMLMLVVCMFALTACGAEESLPNEETYRTRSDQYMAMLSSMDQTSVDALVAELEADFDDFEQQIELYPYIGGTGEKFEFTADAYLSMFKSYASNMEDFGSFVGLKEYEGGSVNSDNETTYNTVYEYTDHDVRLSLVYVEEGIVVNATVDPILSTGEILVKAGLNTLIGMGVVFVVLILISLVISCFAIIPKIEAKLNKKNEAPAAAPAPNAAPAPAAAPVEPADDLQLVAVITAAVAAAMGTTSTDGFVVRSIKRKSNNKWKRA